MFLKSLSHRLSETHKMIRIVDPRPARPAGSVPANAPGKPAAVTRP